MEPTSEHTAPREPDLEPFPLPPPGPPVLPVDVGDRVFVAVWRANLMPDGSQRGAWSLVPGRVISVRADGSAAVYETYSNAPTEDDTPQASRLRFAAPRLMFPDAETANKALPGLADPS